MHVNGVCIAQVAHSNIPADVLHEAHEAYLIVCTDFTENRKLTHPSALVTADWLG